MKGLVQNIYTSPKYTRALEWGKLITISGSAQVLVQAISFISGILVIRLLPTHEYALYTLANTMLGTMTLLADGGITAGVMSQGGKVWQDHKKLGSVLATGIYLRKKFAIGSLLIATPVLLFLLQHHGASWQMSMLVTLSLIPAFFTALSGQLLEIAPKLRQDIVPLQKIQIEANLGRLTLLGLSIFVFPWAFVAVLAAGLPQFWANMQLRKTSGNYADHSQKSNAAIQKEILVMVKRMLPGVIYYCVSGQITIWLISFFGSTAAVAHIGALGRLAMVLSLFNVLFTTLVSPRFARLLHDPKLLFSRFIQIHAGLLALSICIIATVWNFSSEVLWILGEAYSNLTTELVLTIVGSCLSLIAGASFSLYISRGWVINPVISIPVSIAPVACGAAFIDLSSLEGILMLNIFVAIVQVIMNMSYGLIKIMKVT